MKRTLLVLLFLLISDSLCHGHLSLDLNRCRYNHDGIGNRKQAKLGFEPDNFVTWDYTGNDLNQYQAVTFDTTTDNFTYDLDGNLTQDKNWNYTWNAENRLTKLESLETRSAMPIQKLAFDYDAHGRRVSKTVLALNDDNTTYTTTLFRRFVYDGWNLIAELDQDGSPVSSFVWGSDVSGSMQGAGGVGGLLMAKHWHIGDNATTFPAYDGNGNIRGLFRSDNGTIETYCSYDPFGQTFTYNRNPAAPNPFGFLTKPFDNETGLYYYGKRYKSDRWINRDLIEEEGGLNLYAYVKNDPINHIDPLGLRCPCNTCDKWNLTIITVISGGINAAVLTINTELRADDSCIMKRHEKPYMYAGAGIGIGAKYSLSISGSNQSFNTSCIKWEDHNGLGSINSFGLGIYKSWGILRVTTPQKYLSYPGWSYGADASAIVTVGYWRTRDN